MESRSASPASQYEDARDDVLSPRPIQSPNAQVITRTETPTENQKEGEDTNIIIDTSAPGEATQNINSQQGDLLLDLNEETQPQQQKITVSMQEHIGDLMDWNDDTVVNIPEQMPQSIVPDSSKVEPCKEAEQQPVLDESESDQQGTGHEEGELFTEQTTSSGEDITSHHGQIHVHSEQTIQDEELPESDVPPQESNGDAEELVSVDIAEDKLMNVNDAEVVPRPQSAIELASDDSIDNKQPLASDMSPNSAVLSELLGSHSISEGQNKTMYDVSDQAYDITREGPQDTAPMTAEMMTETGETSPTIDLGAIHINTADHTEFIESPELQSDQSAPKMLDNLETSDVQRQAETHHSPITIPTNQALDLAPQSTEISSAKAREMRDELKAVNQISLSAESEPTAQSSVSPPSAHEDMPATTGMQAMHIQDISEELHVSDSFDDFNGADPSPEFQDVPPMIVHSSADSPATELEAAQNEDDSDDFGDFGEFDHTPIPQPVEPPQPKSLITGADLLKRLRANFPNWKPCELGQRSELPPEILPHLQSFSNPDWFRDHAGLTKAPFDRRFWLHSEARRQSLIAVGIPLSIDPVFGGTNTVQVKMPMLSFDTNNMPSSPLVESKPIIESNVHDSLSSLPPSTESTQPHLETLDDSSLLTYRDDLVARLEEMNKQLAKVTRGITHLQGEIGTHNMLVSDFVARIGRERADSTQVRKKRFWSRSPAVK